MLQTRIRIALGDITQLDADAYVTAANEQLMGGGGVDGAVHRAAGPELVAASLLLAPCPAGEARITPGFKSRAAHIIHAVGPIYHDGKRNEATQLASAYRQSLVLASDNQLEHIVFPCISTGVYHYPMEEACGIAVETVVEWLDEQMLPNLVTFCCYGEDNYELYRNRLTSLGIIDDEKP